MDAPDRELLEATVGEAIAGAAATGRPEAVDGVIAELGWLEMLDAEPDDAIGIVFEALGATNAAASVLDDVVASALGLQPRGDLSVLLPTFGRWHAPGRIDDGQVQAVGLATARIASASEIVVVCGDGGIMCVVSGGAFEERAVLGVDPDARLHTVRVDVAGTPAPLDAAAWPSAVALGRRAVAHQIAAASREMLSLACAHALERVQFGRPVARFQAVRHRLAEALVVIEALDAALGAAADEPGPDTAALVKVLAGRAARTVASHSQQILAGIGFTTDHPFHRFMKRTMLLDGLLGSADDVVVDIGRRLLATRSVPTLVEL